MGKIKAFGKSKNKKRSPKESWYIFFITILSIFSVILLSIFLSNPFSQAPLINLGQKMLGDNINIRIEDSGSFSQTVSFYGSLLPEFEMPQNAYLTLLADQEDCKARAKVFMYDSSGRLINLSVQFTSDWEMNEDGYYYYNSTLTPSLVLKFLQSIVMPSSEVGIYSCNLYNIIITVETLPVVSDYLTLWGLI